MNRARQRQLGGSAVRDLLRPNVEGVRGEMKEQGRTPKDHHSDNLRQIKEKQVQNRVKREWDRQPKKEFKLKEFEDVRPKVFDNDQYDKIRKKGEVKKKKAKKASPPAKKKIRKKKVVRKKDDDFDVDYVEQNKLESVLTRKKKAKRVNKKEQAYQKYKKKRTGQVPKYLVDRKKEWKRKEEARKERIRKRKECPPGMRLLPEEERLATLSLLKDNRKKVEEQLRKFPIAIYTERKRKARAELESKLDEIEEAVKLFSRQKVFVSKD